MEKILRQESVLEQHWWALALRGLAALAFGILILCRPDVMLEIFVMLFGIFAVADGIFAVAAGLKHKEKRGLNILHGIFGIAVGLIAFCVPEFAAAIIVLLIGIWALLTGILQIIAAFGLPSGVSGKGLLGINGLLSLVFGVILVARPGVGLLAVMWIIGIYAIVASVMLFSLAATVRSAPK